MKAAKNVYALITILILIPILIKRIEGIRDAMNIGHKSLARRHIIYLSIVCIIVCAFTISLYSFTIVSEAPLVAEQVNDMFVHCAKRGLTQTDFENMLYNKKLALDIESLEYDEIIDYIDFRDDYEVYLSEGMYTDGDKDIIYCEYRQDDETLYLKMGFKPSNTRWQLHTLDVTDENELKEVDFRMKFFKIN